MKLTEEKKSILSTILCLIFMILGFIFEKNGLTFYPIIFILAIFFGGFKQTKDGLIETLENKHLNVDLLMALAAVGACIIGNWFEGAMLTFIFCLSGALEEYTTNKSKNEIASLMNMQPETALLLNEQGKTIETAVNELQIGDLILVPKGASVPIDGTLSAGVSTIDEAAITGESVPVEKTKNDPLFGGTINLGDAITMIVTTNSENTLFSKIIRLVDEAQNTPSKTASFIEKLENRYVKIVLIAIPLMILIPYLLFSWSWNESFYRGMVLLVVASPCALVASATPATLAAISNGARNGVLFKGGVYLENLASLKAIAFDKTGTLTHGAPVVTDAVFLTNKQKAINSLVAMEMHSTHPLAQAIINRFNNETTVSYNQIDVKNIIGFGMETIIDTSIWRVGKKSFNDQIKLNKDIQNKTEQLQNNGKTVIYLFENQELVAYFGLLDIPKQEAKSVIHYFKENGILTTMITGDHDKTAETIAIELEIDQVYANCLPEDKTLLIKEQKEKYGINAMVGDGINDAPALANAAIGVAMGEGTDIAMDVADMVLMQNDLEKLQMSHQLSKKLKRIVTQNIVFSSGIILLLVLSNFFQIINLPLGVIGHEGSTILVILNGLRMLKTIPLEKPSKIKYPSQTAKLV
ncbi:heavy metal translocating P-type ATPase [Enterococcus haemoperoxidus ATCC BAA-382]|uniref:Cadmium-translocating P-type ATPase n=1 Tax=Enterococcus haemoperoxidus ATCC BAA-382 TaxID=1158608 RepID=R2SX47_9ENTE|nr:heavy metal translocating P-type ATPase [Enterococcus haemoperoxidus]EOH99805.1 heavy metal translocating P-type ATPase [Enterococcus haemoperoxidus ATCC BAA-382]EOT62453.1 cadmium-translocating P-type ATPase [Enterococcus haemoperoxidus ATCC BAA-382]OJG54309.1 heavy metal translocating P-type ATPase [Enterococcus haemoperoxidus]